MTCPICYSKLNVTKDRFLSSYSPSIVWNYVCPNCNYQETHWKSGMWNCVIPLVVADSNQIINEVKCLWFHADETKNKAAQEEYDRSIAKARKEWERRIILVVSKK
jgi:hypothetical protein